MTLEDTYKQFLAAPNASSLAGNASLHYITTLVTVNGPNQILKHLAGQVHDLKKNEEKFLSVVEGRNALAAEVHTTIEFLARGGAYLPTLDDNFLTDRVVTFPIIHFVTFDEDGRIQQVRLSWDQGSLLKLIDVIGKTGRNWPIHAGKDQIHLISASIKSSGSPVDDSTTEDTYARSRGNSQNALRDPHASLDLFTPRAKTVVDDSIPAVVARRASAKPPQRDYRDLFAGNESDQSPASAVKGGDEEIPSPVKPAIIATKAGAGKNYAPSRLFETDEIEETTSSAEQEPPVEHFYRPNPAKYQHFEFADGSDPQDAPKPAPKDVKKSKHGSQWNFEDFMTPQKPAAGKVLANDVVHWGNEDEEAVESPIKQKHILKPRKDTQTNIEFQDDGTPEGGSRIPHRTRGAGHNTGLGLYQNNVYDEEERGQAGGEDFKRLDTIANVKDRSKDFDPHFSMTDDSPAVKPASDHLPGERAKVIKMMDASWTAFNESPSQKENLPAAGPKPTAGTGKDPLSENINTPSQRNDNPKVTGGDGMGGRKGAGRQWGIGDESDGEGAGGISRPGKYKTRNQPSGDFWNF